MQESRAVLVAVTVTLLDTRGSNTGGRVGPGTVGGGTTWRAALSHADNPPAEHKGNNTLMEGKETMLQQLM
ncbi:hypothetical protein E2C01_014406 [Portunus trituberculatus]|uniref:Uncharacterized protein n=1 Tax=Portunus trituberculatus TaxID=210409 RepID=A0A5B7DIR1_PORTR|nr:hypothetical protein [Portunus trituberculatus]